MLPCRRRAAPRGRFDGAMVYSPRPRAARRGTGARPTPRVCSKELAPPQGAPSRCGAVAPPRYRLSLGSQMGGRVGARQAAGRHPALGAPRFGGLGPAPRSGIACMARGIRRQLTSLGCCWHGSCGGFRIATSSLWVAPVMARSRPHGFAVNTVVT